jgi:NADPH-dependent 2,4-dienoyl-CoA reductase/sulfur reductase-like enzyme
MADNRTFVIVGAGLAGAKAAQTLREEGFAGRVVIVGDEAERPYERPPLSKGLLLGSATRDSVYVHEADWYDKHDVELRSGVRADAIDRDAKQVVLAGGERIGYDRLLLATGSRPRRLPLPGADLDGVHVLRALAHSDRLDATLTEGTRLVVIGAGWIGLEIAAAARARGVTVAVVEMAHLPLQRVLGDRIAEVFAGLHREHGVGFHFDAGVSELRGGGRVEEVALADGTVLPADAVLVAVGAQPNIELAERAGLDVGDGVLVDARLASSDPDIFAAGDVAGAEHPLFRSRIRVEHWANALNMGPAAARGMLGQDAPYDKLPYFYTDQYDLGMEYSGFVESPGSPDVDVVVRGDLGTDGAAPEFVAFWVTGGRVLAGMNVNVWDVTDDIQDLVRAGCAGRTVDPARLADPDVPLGELLA